MSANLDKLRDLRPLIVTLLQRVDEAIGPPGDDLRTGKTPAAIVRLLEREGREMSLAQIVDALQVAGRDVTDAAVSQACHRLVRAGTILRVRHGVYARRAA